MHRLFTALGFYLLLFISACNDLPEDLRSRFSISVTTPLDKSKLEATDLLHIKATIKSEDELKQYSVHILSSTDSSVLFSSTELVSGKYIEINEKLDILLDTERSMILKIQATDINSESAERVIIVTKQAIHGYDERLGLAVSMIHYTENPVNDISKMKSEFVLTNFGEISYKKDETLYINSTFNNQYFDLRLIPGYTTALKLHKDLNKGDTLRFNPGYVDGKAMLATNLPGIYQAPELKLCIVVWGTSEASVQHYKPGATLCKACGTYKP